MKIGIYSGSFNPIHNGHVALANYLQTHTDLREIWLLVSPQNPLKSKDTLLNDQDRFEMVKLALQSFPNLKASDIEFSLPRPSYTIQTLRYLTSQYPDDEFVLIIGSDNLCTFNRWKDYNEILNNYDVYVYPRQGYKINIPADYKRVQLINAPLYNISSTDIRNYIHEKKDISSLVPRDVARYIYEKGLYQNF